MIYSETTYAAAVAATSDIRGWQARLKENKQAVVPSLIAENRELRIKLAEARIGSTSLQDSVSCLNKKLSTLSEEPLHILLSERELEVFTKLVAGLSVTEISMALGLSVKTVSTFKTRAMKKLKTKTVSEMVQYAIRHQLMPSGD